MTKQLIIYHAQCLDGFTAAWVVAKHLELTLGPDSYELYPATYGEPPPPLDLLKGRTVYIVDFSYPRDTLLCMWEAAHELVVLDHHRTAEAELKDLSFCTFNMHHSGARLAANHFGIYDRQGQFLVGLGGLELIDYVEDYDLWRFELPHTMAIHYYLSTLGHTLWNWDQAATRLGEDPNGVIAIGNGIADYVEQLAESICNEAIEGKLPKQRGSFKEPVLLVNCPTRLTSLVAHTLLDRYPKVNVVACWHPSHKGHIEVGLRSRDGKKYDVGKMAKVYGGGGHPTAAGFRLGEKP